MSGSDNGNPASPSKYRPAPNYPPSSSSAVSTINPSLDYYSAAAYNPQINAALAAVAVGGGGGTAGGQGYDYPAPALANHYPIQYPPMTLMKPSPSPLSHHPSHHPSMAYYASPASAVPYHGGWMGGGMPGLSAYSVPQQSMAGMGMGMAGGVGMGVGGVMGVPTASMEKFVRKDRLRPAESIGEMIRRIDEYKRLKKKGKYKKSEKESEWEKRAKGNSGGDDSNNNNNLNGSSASNNSSSTNESESNTDDPTPHPAVPAYRAYARATISSYQHKLFSLLPYGIDMDQLRNKYSHFTFRQLKKWVRLGKAGNGKGAVTEKAKSIAEFEDSDMNDERIDGSKKEEGGRRVRGLSDEEDDDDIEGDHEGGYQSKHDKNKKRKRAEYDREEADADSDSEHDHLVNNAPPLLSSMASSHPIASSISSALHTPIPNVAVTATEIRPPVSARISPSIPNQTEAIQNNNNDNNNNNNSNNIGGNNNDTPPSPPSSTSPVDSKLNISNAYSSAANDSHPSTISRRGHNPSPQSNVPPPNNNTISNANNVHQPGGIQKPLPYAYQLSDESQQFSAYPPVDPYLRARPMNPGMVSAGLPPMIYNPYGYNTAFQMQAAAAAGYYSAPPNNDKVSINNYQSAPSAYEGMNIYPGMQPYPPATMNQLPRNTAPRGSIHEYQQ